LDLKLQDNLHKIISLSRLCHSHVPHLDSSRVVSRVDRKGSEFIKLF